MKVYRIRIPPQWPNSTILHWSTAQFWKELLVQDMRLPWFSTFWGLLNHVVICCHKSQASWIMLSHFNMFQSCIALVTVVLSIAFWMGPWVTSLQVVSTQPATKSFPEYSAAPGPSVGWFIDVYWCLLGNLGMGASEVTKKDSQEVTMVVSIRSVMVILSHPWRLDDLGVPPWLRKLPIYPLVNIQKASNSYWKWPSRNSEFSF